MVEQAVELSSNPMGKLLLGKIGLIYYEQAMQQLGGLDALGAEIDEFKGGLQQKAAIAGSLYKTYKAAKKMQNEHEKEMIAKEEEEMKKAMEESKKAAESG